MTLPLPSKVKWAGDTPVVTLTDLVIPGLEPAVHESSFTTTNTPGHGHMAMPAAICSA